MNFISLFLICLGVAGFLSAVTLINLLMQIGPEDDLTPTPKYAEFEWVKKVINSCVTFEQARSAAELVTLWENKHFDPKMYDVLLDLLQKRREWILKNI